MKKYTSLFLILIIILFVWLGRMLHNNEENDFSNFDFEQIKERGYICVSFSHSEDGLLVDSNGVKSGFAYEKVVKFVDEHDIVLKYKLEDNLDKQIEMLNSGECDLIARDIPITKAMKNEVMFTDAFSKDRMVLVQRKKSGNSDSIYVYNQLNLIGKHVSLPANSPFITRVKNLSKELGDSIYVDIEENHDRDLLITLVSKGDIDYTVSDLRTAKRLSKRYENLDIHLPIGFTTLQGWAVRKGSPKLCEEINKYFNVEE